LSVFTPDVHASLLLEARAFSGEAFSGAGNRGGTDMKGQNGKIVKEAFYGERNCLKGRMNVLAEVLVF